MGRGGTPQPKPAKGSARQHRLVRRDERKAHEDRQKKKVVRRDGLHKCRLIPRCEFEKDWRMDTAHLDDKGMGGDPQGIRSRADLMIRACMQHHVGPWSLHSKDLRVEFLTEDKANGPIAVWGRDRHTGEWYQVMRERSVGVVEHD